MAIFKEFISGSASATMIANVQMIGGIAIDGSGSFQALPAADNETALTSAQQVGILGDSMSGSLSVIHALNKLSSSIDSADDPAGNNTEVQFNNNGAFGADAGLTYVASTPALTLGHGQEEDVKFVLDGNAQDYYVGLDDGTDSLMIGLGNAVGTTPAITVDENQKVTLTKDLEVQGDTSTFTSGEANDPLVVLKNTKSDANSARLQFVKDKGAAGADGDDVGLIEFVGDNDAQQQTTFAKILAEIADASDGAEGGKLSLGVASHDGGFANGLILTDGSADDEIDVTVGNGAASVTTVAGNLTVTSDLTVSGNDITFGNGATIVNTSADILTVTEATTVLSGDLTVQGNDLDFAAGAANIGASVGANALTLGGATSTVITAGGLTVDGSDGITMSNGATIVNGDANTLTITEAGVVLSGDLTVQGNDLDFAAANARIGASVGANELVIGSTNGGTQIKFGDGAQGLGVRIGEATSVEDTIYQKRAKGQALFLNAFTASAIPQLGGGVMPAIKVSASVDLMGASIYEASTGRVKASGGGFSGVIPFLSLQGADTLGAIRDYKLQISGGILQVTEYNPGGH